MPDPTIYHNPRCSKSREALSLLQSRGCEPRVIAYMQEGLNRKRLRELLGLLGLGARDLLRKNEAAYRERGLADPNLSETQLIDAMVAEPCLMQRPIVVNGKRAVIARPAERALELIG
jgi:arsenate reductase (glutaredoxin)